MGTVTLTPNAGVTASTQFEVGVSGKLFSVSSAPGSFTNITAAMPLLFNGQTTNAPTTNAPIAADADFDGDGVVGLGDFFLLVDSYGSSVGDPNYYRARIVRSAVRDHVLSGARSYHVGFRLLREGP